MGLRKNPRACLHLHKSHLYALSAKSGNAAAVTVSTTPQTPKPVSVCDVPPSRVVTGVRYVSELDPTHGTSAMQRQPHISAAAINMH
jgi:hypothetical protein